MQPALPTLVRRWTPERIGLATATYTCGLLCGEVLPALWPFAPNLPFIGAGWRAALVQWSLPVLATAVLTILMRPRGGLAPDRSVPRVWPDWRQGAIWRVGVVGRRQR